MKATSLLLFSLLTTFSYSSELMIYQEDNKALIYHSRVFEKIQESLMNFGIRFERWDAHDCPVETMCAQQIQQIYEKDIWRLQEEEGFSSYDVISISSGYVDKESLRQKFLFEHTHDEPEIRFFVSGSGLFYLHIDDKVISVLCEQGDLIAVPENIPHWFDMGRDPSFSAIRFFTKKEGWIAYPTGSAIAQGYVKE